MLEISNEDITGIVAAVFESTLGMVIEPVGNVTPREGEEVCSSLVGITGNWDGAVIVACTKPLAVQLAMAMFSVPATDVGDDDINDALGELANMVGGNFKSMLPPVCSLSLPTVVDGRNFRIRVPGAKVVRELEFEAASSRVRVTVAERAA